MAVTQGTLLLIVRRDQSEQQLRTEAQRQFENVPIVVDRRTGERRVTQNPRIAIQRRRADRRARTWVAAALQAEGIALIRV
jgi:hypothetical protein